MHDFTIPAERILNPTLDAVKAVWMGSIWFVNPIEKAEAEIAIDALLVDQPATAQPTAEQVRNAIHDAMCGRTDCEPQTMGPHTRAAAAILALLPGRPESVVKAEALREHRRRVARFTRPGLISRATVLADLDDYADRLDPRP